LFDLERQLADQLSRLRQEYDLQGIKAEFEAEGSSFRDLMRLRRLTDKANIRLFLKLGGVEGLRDIKDSLEIGVDGLIAPMVESPFGVKKFVDAVDSIYKEKTVHRSINVETKGAVEQIDEILNFAKGKVDNVTVGRTDLCASYFDPAIQPDSDFIFTLLEELGNKIATAGMTMTVGGSISQNSVELFLNHQAKWQELIWQFETRKVLMPSKMMLKPNAIEEAFRFEELYILSKQALGELFMESEMARLARLRPKTPPTE